MSSLHHTNIQPKITSDTMAMMEGTGKQAELLSGYSGRIRVLEEAMSHRFISCVGKCDEKYDVMMGELDGMRGGMLGELKCIVVWFEKALASQVEAEKVWSDECLRCVDVVDVMIADDDIDEMDEDVGDSFGLFELFLSVCDGVEGVENWFVSLCDDVRVCDVMRLCVCVDVDRVRVSGVGIVGYVIGSVGGVVDVNRVRIECVDDVGDGVDCLCVDDIDVDMIGGCVFDMRMIGGGVFELIYNVDAGMVGLLELRLSVLGSIVVGSPWMIEV